MLRRETNFNLGRSARQVWVAHSILVVALLLLGVMVGGMLSPIGVFMEEAKAEEVNLVATYSSYEAASATITMADSVNGEIAPDRDGGFTNLATTVRVSVAHSDYYDLSIYGTNIQNNNGEVIIKPVAAGSKPREFGNNTWGYSLIENTSGQAGVANSNTAYQPVPATSTNILRQNTNAETKTANDTYTLNFGAKVDAGLPAGTYSSAVTLSVVANPAFIATGFDRVSTMQELTPEICREIGTAEDSYGKDYAYTDPLGNTYWTKQLKDKRDNKLYWVAKLRDGNCWMTQNLALDIPREGLTSELTALAPGKTSWRPKEATRTPATANRFTLPCTGASASKPVTVNGTVYTNETVCMYANANYSWDEGMYVLAYPGMGDIKLADGRAADKGGLAGYTNKEWLASKDIDPKMLLDGQLVIDVSGTEWTASTDPDFTAKHGGYAVDLNSKTYDAHYLVGNYYQWLAATAQTVTEGATVTTDGQSVQGSICAKGWQLPLGGQKWNSTSGSSFRLIKSYAGDALKVGGAAGSNADKDNGYSSLSNTIAGSTKTVENVFAGSPMHFLRVGYTSPSSGHQHVRLVGVYGYYWSSVAASATSARYLYFGPVDVRPSYGGSRGFSFSVRCLVNAN